MEKKLAIDGGTPVRTEPMPARRLIDAEEKAAAIAVLDDSIASGDAYRYGGKFERQYERDFVEFMGGGFADGVSSGTSAIYAALAALRLEPFSEVVVPAVTNAGGAMPVALLSLVPALADSDPRHYNVCAETVEAALSERTRAVVVTHLGGAPVDMDPVMELARSRGLYVIEDCAQSHGALYKGRPVGSIGDFGAFSCMSGKHHCTGGQGGVVYTTNEELHWEARRLADRGKPIGLDDIAGSDNVVAGLNLNLDDLSAAIGSAQLKKLPDFIRRRRAVGLAVREGLEKSRVASLAWEATGSENSYWYLLVRLDTGSLRVDKFEFCKALKAEGIPNVAQYPQSVWDKVWWKNRAVFGNNGFPWTSPEYKGPAEPEVRIENAQQTLADHFMIKIHENFGPREAGDIVAGILKVEAAYRQ